MYKYDIPYEEEHVYQPVEMLQKLGYKITGAIVDACILDTTFYHEVMGKDLCMLQVLLDC